MNLKFIIKKSYFWCNDIQLFATYLLGKYKFINLYEKFNNDVKCSTNARRSGSRSKGSF